MSLPPTYRRRKSLAAGTQSDVFEYGPFPAKLRVQIERVLTNAIGQWDDEHYGDPIQNQLWMAVLDAMRQEEGKQVLADVYPDSDAQQELQVWMGATSDVDAYLEALEWVMRYINGYVRDNVHEFQSVQSIGCDDAISEINARIREAGYGYEFVNGEILQIDSLFLHVNAVIPALTLTNNPDFASVNAEYLKAHEAFRHADYETALTECGKAFESTLKVIADKRGWAVKPTDPAAKLIDAAVTAQFLQPYMQTGFSALRAMLDSGVNTLRNKTAAHGAGVQLRVVPQELAAFQLHQAASVIVFLIESHQAQP